MAFSFPKSFILIICSLKFRELLFKILHSCLELHYRFCLSITNVVSFTSTWSKIINLSFILLYLLNILIFHLSLFFFQAAIIILKNAQLFLKISVFFVQNLFDFFKSSLLLLKFTFPQVSFVLDSFYLSLYFFENVLSGILKSNFIHLRLFVHLLLNFLNFALKEFNLKGI